MGFIDFDLAGPTTRLADAYNTAMHWVPLRPPADIWPTWTGVDQMARLRRFADAYGLSAEDRAAIPALGVERARFSYRRMEAAAQQHGGGWARMWAEGVGDTTLRREAWLVEQRDDLLRSLLS